MKNIRNFCIIAHIDHGKSTLADRLLELTGTVAKREMKEQLLDTMDLERERGITIKLQPARMSYARINADDTRIDADNDAGKQGLLHEDLTYKLRGCFFNVYNNLGPGHKESIYQNALESELKKQNIEFDKEKNIDVIYGDKKIGNYRPDFVIDKKIIVELKALSFTGELEKKQLWTYLKGSDYRLAFLVNFGAPAIEIERVVYDSIRENQRNNPRESAFILNLIDTPGHVDFSYEVSRSLAAVEGALLIVDAAQGIQAQTLAVASQAQAQGLVLVPVINKIDLPAAEPEKVAQELINTFGFKESEMIYVSAKTGKNVEQVLEAIVERVPAPEGSPDNPLRALIFDSNYDSYRGVIIYFRIMDGSLVSGDMINIMAVGKKTEAQEIGYFRPQMEKASRLSVGEIGYIVTALKDISLASVGDTITLEKDKGNVSPLPGYKEVQPTVFAGIYPVDGNEYNKLRDGLSKLKLNDSSLVFVAEKSPALGLGFRCGFLGMLHLDIVKERLEREFDLDLVITSPTVGYEIVQTDKTIISTSNPAEFPDPSKILEIREPWVLIEILLPSEQVGAVMEMLGTYRGIHKDLSYLDDKKVIIRYELPLAVMVRDFYDNLKSVSSGYASLSYEHIGMRAGDLVKMDILLAGERIDTLSQIIVKDDAMREGKAVTKKLKDLIPRQMFEVAIQASIGSRVLARESISAMKKDVAGYLYGGDRSRKDKLLKKQKAGKKKMKSLGRVNLPASVFLDLMKK